MICQVFVFLSGINHFLPVADFVRRLRIRMIADMANTNKDTVGQISHKELNMAKKRCYKPHTETRDSRKNICSEIMKRLREVLELETKRLSMHYTVVNSPKAGGGNKIIRKYLH